MSAFPEAPNEQPVLIPQQQQGLGTCIQGMEDAGFPFRSWKIKSKSFTVSLLLSTLAILLNPLDMGPWSLKGSCLHPLLLARLVGHI